MEASGFWKTREDTIIDPSVGDNVVNVSMVPAAAGSAPIIYYHTPLLAPEVQKELDKGIAALKANRLDAAQKALKLVLKKSPNHPAALYVMGLAAGKKKGNPQEARQYWEKALSFEAVQGASIEAVNVETGVKYATKGNDTGEYRFTNLPVGAYNVSASATNFATTTINGLRVELNKTVTLPITLEVKSVANTIEVSGAAQPFGYHHGSGNQ